MSVIKYVDQIDEIEVLDYKQKTEKRARDVIRHGVCHNTLTHANCDEDNKEVVWEPNTGVKALVEYTQLADLYECQYYGLLIPVRDENGKHQKLYYIVDSILGQSHSAQDKYKFDVVPLHEVSKNVEVGELVESQVSDNDIPSELLMFKI